MPAFDSLQPTVDIGAPLATIVDQSVANTTYVCEAPAGTASSAAAWRITKIVVVGSVTTTTYGGTAQTGYGRFDQVADNRLTSVTYA
jgi:hypothetical protein